MSSISSVGYLIKAAEEIVHAVGPTGIAAVAGTVAVIWAWGIECLSNSRKEPEPKPNAEPPEITDELVKLGNDGFQCISNEACQQPNTEPPEITDELVKGNDVFFQYSLDDAYELISYGLESPKDKLAFRSTNTCLYDLSMSSPQWRAFLEKYFPSALASACPNADYQKLYREHAVQRNHLKMIETPSHVFQMGGRVSFTTLKVQGDFLFGCFEGIAKIWNIHTGQLIHTFCHDSKNGEMSCLKVDKDILFVVLGNKIKSFNIHTGKELHTFPDQCDISCLEVQGNLLFAGAEGCLIIIWEISSGCLVQQFLSDIGNISCLKAHEDRLFAGAHDGRMGIIDIKDPSKPRLLNAFQEHKNAIEHMDIHGNLLYTYSKDKAVNLWDMDKYELVPMRNEDVGRFHSKSRVGFDLFNINCPKAYGDYLFKGLEDGKVEISDILTKRVLYTFRADESGCQALGVSEDFLFTGSGETIKSWDLLPCPSIYPLDVLRSNLQILGQMVHALHAQNFDDLQHLNTQLHPNYQWYLNDQSLILNKEGQLCSKAISRAQTMACLELLLHPMYKLKQNDISQILKQLRVINEGNLSKLYGLLYDQCQPVTSDAKWGEHAFENVKEGPASRKAMIQAVQSLQALLREEWEAPKQA